MLTVKAYHAHYVEPTTFAYVLIDEDSKEEVQRSNDIYAREYDALYDGIKEAEKINGMIFEPTAKFEIIYLEERILNEDEIIDTKDKDIGVFYQTSYWERKVMIEQEVLFHCEPTSPHEFALLQECFQIYSKKFRGKLSKDECKPLFKLFEQFVAAAVIGAPADDIMLFEAEIRNVSYRRIALDRWIEFMKRIGNTRNEAIKIWKAMDIVSAIT